MRLLTIATALLVAGASSLAAAAPPAPAGAHPRIWLDAATRAALVASAGDPSSPVGRALASCADARNDPAGHADGGWQGFNYVDTLSSCLLAYVAGGNTLDRDTALAYFNVLLDDYATVGDGLGGDDVVTHDTGYAMRTFAPYAALAYDWLHDEPGMSEALRAHARARFLAWTDWYRTSGYLNDVPGSNYHAGYVFAATLIAIAEGGEAGSDGDGLWAHVVDTLWTAQMAPAFAPGGVLANGDWPEGWQYGPLSVLEHAMAARALAEQGVAVAGVDTWAGALTLRNLYALTPVTEQVFVGGDADIGTPNMAPSINVLHATIAGPAPETAKAWARSLVATLGLTATDGWENLYGALAGAASGVATPYPTDAPTALLTGAGNLFTRGAWQADTAWSVFHCSRQLVPDHEHPDAGNWVLSRGADDLVVDPSPYGSLSTLSGNGPAVDSHVLPPEYSPSQAGWGTASGLRWQRQSSTGVVAARCDYADNFTLQQTPSDVPTALRDYVFVPVGGDGVVVLVDRIVAEQADQALHLRIRTPGTLALAGETATLTAGASELVIQQLYATSGVPSVRDMPPETAQNACWMVPRTCDNARFAGQEERLDVSGPAALAIHVVTATGTGASVAPAELLAGPGYRAALFWRDPRRVIVVTNDAPDAALGATLTYRVPQNGALHVVLDAPASAAIESDVVAS
ncbi:MAG: hypothetical protein IT373_31465, partial [Polyangiaceae bacterium]|nr:hypothetical protein [Polyangiaceae bacterium]